MACPNCVHDVLFSKARTVLNNNVKRLWFKINPFLERKDSIKGFSQPEQLGKFVQLLQSSVVCEQYFTDETSTFQKVTVEEFWDFLYSDKWSHGCSVRVLEGQLLEYLLTALYVLEKTKIVSHHKTFAFAKNQREKRSCYKPANIEKGCKIIEETLLLEFTYYGRRTEKMQKESSSSTPYPETTTESTFYTITEEEGDQLHPTEILSISRKKKKNIFQYNFDPYSSHSYKRNSIFTSSEEKKEDMDDIARRLEYMVRSGCIKDNPEELEATLKNWMGDDRKESVGQKSNVEIIPQVPSDDTKSSQASTDSDYMLPRSLNLNKFTCTEKINYGDGLDVDVIDDVNVLETFDTEEEFYLGENISNKLSVEISVKEKLRQKLKEKQTLRKEKQAQAKEWEKRRQCLPKYKEIDFSLLSTMKRTPSTPLRAPTFEEFLRILEEEEKYDPRFLRSKQISKKIAKRYNIQREALKSRKSLILQRGNKNADNINLPPINMKGIMKKDNSERPTSGRRQFMPGFAEEVRGVTDSRACEQWVILQETLRTRGSPNRKLTVISDEDERVGYEEREVSASLDYSPTVYDVDFYRLDSAELEVPALFLTSPNGTISELEPEGSDDQCDIVDNITPTISDSLPRIPSKVEVNKEESRINKKSSSKVAKVRKSSTMKGKLSKRSTLAKEPVPASSSESDTECESELIVFDTRKLNLKYSFERLRGKPVKKKQPSFINILKKYYKIQKVVNKLQGGFSKKGGRRKGIFAKLRNFNIEESEDEPVIGKLKKFDFLEHKPPYLEASSPVSFATVSMLEFTAKVLKSLDDFVVRKEQVISDYCDKSSITLTFTRKSAFKLKLA